MGGRSSSFGKKTGGGVKLDLPELEGSEKQIAWAKDIGIVHEMASYFINTYFCSC